MPAGENAPTDPNQEVPVYGADQPVRVRYEAGGQTVSEDDWRFGGRNEETGNYQVYKHDEEQNLRATREIPPEVFESWQREKAAEAAGQLATSRTVETTGPVEEIIEEEWEAEEEIRPEWWRVEDGKYVLSINVNDLADKIKVPPDIITSALDKGFSPDALIAAKRNYFTARKLRQADIDWGTKIAPEGANEAIEKASQLPFDLPVNDIDERLADRLPRKPEEVAAMSAEEQAVYLRKWGIENADAYKDWYEKNAKPIYERERAVYKDSLEQYLSEVGLEDDPITKERKARPVDPMFYLEARGNMVTINTEELTDLIEKAPRQLSKEMKRPGGINVPLLRRVGWLYLALSMNRNERRMRREKGSGLNHMDGLLRLGIPRIRRNWRFIRDHDVKVAVHKNKLSFWNSYEYKGPENETKRKREAEKVMAVLQRQAAIDARVMMHPEHAYVHAPLKAALGEYAKEKEELGFMEANRQRLETQQQVRKEIREERGERAA